MKVIGKDFPLFFPGSKISRLPNTSPPKGRPHHHLQNWLVIILANNWGRQVHEAPSVPTSNAQSCPEVLTWKPVSSPRFLTQICQQKQWPFFCHILGLGLWVTKEGGGNTTVSVVTSRQVDSPVCSGDFGVSGGGGALSPLVQKRIKEIVKYLFSVYRAAFRIRLLSTQLLGEIVSSPGESQENSKCSRKGFTS